MKIIQITATENSIIALLRNGKCVEGFKEYRGMNKPDVFVWHPLPEVPDNIFDIEV